jgi:hypothetical protein
MRSYRKLPLNPAHRRAYAFNRFNEVGTTKCERSFEGVVEHFEQDQKQQYRGCKDCREKEMPNPLTFKKNNYGPISHSLVLQYRDGLFLPETAPHRRWFWASDVAAAPPCLMLRLRWFDTAAASSADVQVPMGARMIGTSMPSTSQRDVFSIVQSPR